MNEPKYALALHTRLSQLRAKLLKALCIAITYGALLFILVLAIPACFSLFIIGVVWDLADRIIRKIEKHRI